MLSDVLGDKTYLVQQFITDCIGLVKSLLIVCHDEADLYNQQQKIFYPDIEIGEDKSTWRYYLHLTGAAHSIDTPVAVKSIDDGSTFNLTKTSIQSHPFTKAKLLEFGYDYDSLVAAHKQQEQYILACLIQPTVNIYDVIDAPSFSIIGYDSGHVESNEQDLIYKLSEFIENYKVTWMLPYYGLSDSLFLAAQYTIFHMALLKKVLAIRLQNAKTPQAHSFHVKNYLASHHELDNQYSHLTDKQRFFLYRNIMYLDNHVGRTQTFKSMISQLLDARGIDVFSYSYSQTNVLDGSTNDVVYGFDKTYLGNSGKVSDDANYTVEDIEAKENKTAPSNSSYWASTITSVKKRLSMSNYSKLSTKDIETSMSVYDDNVEYKYAEVLMNYWLNCIENDTASFTIEVKNPKNSLSFRLSFGDAYRLVTVALYQKYGLSPTTLPIVYADRIFKTQGFETLASMKYATVNSDVTTAVTAIRNAIPVINSKIRTASSFAEYITDVYNLEKVVWVAKNSFSEPVNNGQAGMFMGRDHTRLSVSLADPLIFGNGSTTVSGFLQDIGFSELTMCSDTELDALITSILDLVTDGGYSYVTNALSIQNAMMSIFSVLSSYNVQFTNEFNSETFIMIGPMPASFGLTYPEESPGWRDGSVTDSVLSALYQQSLLT